MSKLVYFLRPVGQIGPIKIGCSKLPEGRLEALSIVSPVRLEMIASVPGTHKDERTLHGMFAKHWLHHEWFSASKELLALVDYVSAHGALPSLPEVVPFKRPRKAAVRTARPSKGPRASRMARAERLASDYRAGATTAEIADREDLCLSTVCNDLRLAGITLSRGARKKTEHSVADVARAEEFSRRYTGGETLEAIAKDYGISRERVRQILRKVGVPSLGHRPEHCAQPSPLADYEIVAARMYEAGTRPRAVLEAFPQIGSFQRLYYVLRRLGIPRRKAGAWNVRADDAERTATIATLYEQGLSATEIAGRVPGMKHHTHVYRYLKKAGVKARCDKGWGKRWANHNTTQAAA